MTKFITGKGHFLKCVLKLKQNFKIIKRDSDNSSCKTHFSCECILHWILRRFCPGDTLWFSQFSRGRACQDCLFFLLGGASNPAAGLLTILQLEPLQSPLQATHISFICPMSFDKFPLDEQVLSQWWDWCGWWWWSLITDQYSNFRNYAPPPLHVKEGIITEKDFPVFSESFFGLVLA